LAFALPGELKLARRALNLAAAAVAGFCLAFLIAATLALASGTLLSKQRLATVLNQAFADGSLIDDSHTFL